MQNFHHESFESTSSKDIQLERRNWEKNLIKLFQMFEALIAQI